MAYQVTQLPSPLAKLGEGPVWDIDTQSLYYVDILTPTILRYDYKEKRTYSAKLDGAVTISFIVLVAGKPEHFVIGESNRVLLIHWDGRSEQASNVRTLADLGESHRNVRFNDGKVDPSGRLYTGTMLRGAFGDAFTQSEGQFYRYDNGTMVPLKASIGISNGITWDEPTNPLRMYYIDSPTLEVKAFDVDGEGDLKNETVFVDFRLNGTAPDFVPDGMTSDVDGNLYVATWGGWQVLKVDKTTQKVSQEFKLPVERITSVAFGGPLLDELFVTSAFYVDKPAPAGALFNITGLQVKGKPMHKMIL